MPRFPAHENLYTQMGVYKLQTTDLSVQVKTFLLNLSMKRWNSAFIWCTRFETNSRCTLRSSENICSSSEGAQEKGKTGWNSVYHQNWSFSEFHPLLNANVRFAGFFLISPCVWPNSGFWCCVFLTLRITLLTVHLNFHPHFTLLPNNENFKFHFNHLFI
jgi:hypothetical protein